MFKNNLLNYHNYSYHKLGMIVENSDKLHLVEKQLAMFGKENICRLRLG